MELAHLVDIVEDKCVNCHQCIAVCPVKFANNGSDNVIHLNHELCIGCGECIKACTHQARLPIDDFDSAMQALQHENLKTIAVVAPAVASNFPQTYLNLNGWLKSMGVEAVFDVSFGAELTVKSYLEHIKTENPRAVIAQPCPVIVSYIQIYKPSLIPYLAPADSPMLHTIKMVKEFYPQYKNHKTLVISPCIAKRREFDETGLGDYNITLSRISQYIDEQGVDLKEYSAVPFDNAPAERAVLFSSPGGLLETAERELPAIRNNTRKIEGVNTIYHYLNHFEKAVEKGINPLVIDCLNCELGCNGGTGTSTDDKLQDELEYFVKQRRNELIEKHKTHDNGEDALKSLREVIGKYWKEGLYNRKYINQSEIYRQMVKEPDEKQTEELLHSMGKTQTDDIKNCASCGYNDCKEMAKAIFNGFNRKENCHFYLERRVKERTQELVNNSQELLEAMGKIRQIIG